MSNAIKYTPDGGDITFSIEEMPNGFSELGCFRFSITNIAKTDYTGKRILLVEDNDLNREITTEIIGMTNVTVDTAVNGKEAIEKIADSGKNKYDLVFMDMKQPLLFGLCRNNREQCQSSQ